MTDQDPRSIDISDEERRSLGLWAAECAERVLPLFEAKAPNDARPREAIEVLRLFARGGKRTANLRTVAWAALAAAREVSDPAATAAARAAAYAAGTAYIHALATPHQVKHVLSPAAQGVLAREVAAVDDPKAADEELQWALEHAPSAVREIVRRLPGRAPGRSRLDAVMFQLDSALRQ